ncbi:hypothetical protein PN498_13390 [Oscillatoria sp. CS-180]|uniref:hypothetical protein n=1 Tax=Oscillatoria sp. CS-180 TaxID=3021720 RepID=UPI00232DB906|nr:hypothetical protein [Oscillatoria sp. CS-180]MDB9526988.1 hypothetical protein [Oscillatoria sp. CS-180]
MILSTPHIQTDDSDALRAANTGDVTAIAVSGSAAIPHSHPTNYRGTTPKTVNYHGTIFYPYLIQQVGQKR